MKSERDYLRAQSNDARAAIGATLVDIKSTSAGAADVRYLCRKYPLPALAVCGGTAAVTVAYLGRRSRRTSADRASARGRRSMDRPGCLQRLRQFVMHRVPAMLTRLMFLRLLAGSVPAENPATEVGGPVDME